MNAKTDGSINGAYTRIHEAERSDDRTRVWTARDTGVPFRPFRKMATGRAHGATFRSRGADSESSHLICILRAADGSNF